MPIFGHYHQAGLTANWWCDPDRFGFHRKSGMDLFQDFSVGIQHST
jgi:hypothetical protein